MTAEVPQKAKSETMRELRRMRTRRLATRLSLGVGLPTLCVALYSGMVASPQFESVTTFTIQSADGPSGAGALQFLMASVPGTAGRDTLLVQEFIESRDMVARLDRDHGLRAHYASDSVDWLSRLQADATIDDTHEYYLDHVDVEHDSQSGSVTLHVRAFSAEQAEAFGQAILEASEQMVNEMSERARRDRIRLAEEQVASAEQRLTAARTALVELQAQGAELNPAASAQAILGIRSQLEGELAIARAELATMAATLQPTSPELQTQRRRVGALQRQIDEQTQRLAGEDGRGLSDTIARFEPVYAEKELAQHLYETALGSLEIARVDAARQHRYLVRIAGPSRPEEAAYPIVWRDVITVLLVSFALLGIGTLVIASVREHANV